MSERQSPTRARRAAFAMTMLLLAGAPLACSTQPPASPTSPTESAAPAPEPTAVYRIAPGDVLEIKSVTDGTLNEVAKVGPDGTIAHPMVGYVHAAGRTPEELDAALTEKLAESVLNPSITVIVREYGGSLVFVGGEVFTPQRIMLTGQTTALSAILTAGGYTPEGDLSRVVLIRRGADGLPVTRTLNLEDVTDGYGSNGLDPVLVASDIVIVPPSAVTEANRFVAQYITRMLPGTLNAGFSYTRGVQTFQ